MLRAMVSSVSVFALMAGGLRAADVAPDRKDDVHGVAAVVVKVDASTHAITVRFKDADGKAVEKSFKLADVRVTDETGKSVGLDAIEAGADVVVLEKDGRLAELRRAGKETRRPFDAGRFLEEYDRNKDGFIQREELPPRLRHAFELVDTNKDGKLSREELEAGGALLQPRRRPSDVVNVLVETSDCDEECQSELQTIYDVLRKLDKNKDGKIDVAELKEVREQMVEEHVDELFKELDADHDGKISREESRGRMKRDFDKIDLNKDGFIDREELLKAARERAATPPAERDKDGKPGPQAPRDR